MTHTRSITRFEANCSLRRSGSGVKAIAAHRLIEPRGRRIRTKSVARSRFIHRKRLTLTSRYLRFALLFLRQHFRFPLSGATRARRATSSRLINPERIGARAWAGFKYLFRNETK